MTTQSLLVPVLNAETAPAASRELLKAVRGKMGFIPNMLGTFAHAPALLEGYLALSGIFDKTSLSPTERQLVLLAVSAENECAYCMAAHTAIAGMHKVDAEVIAALRESRPIANPKLEALRRFAVEVTSTRGWPAPETVSRFTDAGYTPVQALEVVLGVGLKTISNYANHLTAVPLDDAFAKVKWTKPTCNAGCSH